MEVSSWPSGNFYLFNLRMRFSYLGVATCALGGWRLLPRQRFISAVPTNQIEMCLQLVGK